MLNIVALQGRLTADPEMKQTQSGVAVARFTLAVDRSFAKAGEERKADFINCIAWRQTAEFVSKYFQKGSAMVLDGSIQTGSYDDKETGKKRYTFDVVANNVSFGGSKGSTTATTATAPAPVQTAANTTAPVSANAEFVEIEDNGDLPF